MNETSNSLAALRKNYTLGQLSEKDVPQDPIELFETWFAQASRAQCPEPNAMVLATANEAGTPSARVVLLKGLSQGDFCFFTNYESQKGKELANRPQASLLFHWHELERQVRINGDVSKLSAAESDEYYLQRPAASRIGAWASPQSQIIESRAYLEQEELRFQKQLSDKCLSVFIMPPSVEALRERLLNRQTETPESIKTRIDKAEYEISFSNQFNAIVKNEVLETACNDAANLLMDFLGPDFTK